MILEFEEIDEELAHLEEDGDVQLIREMNTWTKEVMISQIHLVRWGTSLTCNSIDLLI